VRRIPSNILVTAAALAAIVVGALVVLAVTDAATGLLLAIAALAVATTGIGIAIRSMLADQEGGPAVRPARRAPLVAAVVATATLAAAIVLPHEDAVAGDTSATDATGATQTLRNFLTAAALDDNAYAACQYLTAAEAARVAALAGQGQTCRAALIATPPSLPGVASPRSLRGLRLRTTVHGDRATIDAAGLRFVLVRATAAERNGFAAPHAAWRVAAGATALLVRPA
jgi:hypothetical protein